MRENGTPVKTGFDSFDIFQAGVLPDDFHQKVFDLEIKMEIGTEKMDDQQQVEVIANLMGLYSVSCHALSLPFLSASHRVL